MNAIDLDVRISSVQELPRFLEMAKFLGYSAVASHFPPETDLSEDNIPIYRRVNLESRKLSTLKKQAASARAQYAVVAVPLLGVETANWAAEDAKVDLLMVDFTGKHVLRKTTASMSAKHGTALELSIAPRLGCSGLNRSRIIRNLHDSVTVAIQAGMKIMLSSGADMPIRMRSPVALRNIGMILGLNRRTADNAIGLNQQLLIAQNIERMNGNRIGPGLKIIKSGDDT